MNPAFQNSTEERRSGFSRFFHWLFSWRTFRRALLTFIVLLTLGALVLEEENWRGKRAWEKYKREGEAKGERFDLASFLSKPVPDEQNFAATPFLRSFFRGQGWSSNELATTRQGLPVPQVSIYGDAKQTPPFGGYEKGQLTDLRKWQQFYRTNTSFPSLPQPLDPAHDVLVALGKFEPVLKELREASQRPAAVLPAPIDETLDSLIPALGGLKTLATLLRLHAIANLEAGQGEAALQDMKLAFRLADLLKSQPLLISELVRIAHLTVSVNALWEGMARHQWNEAQLLELQKLVSSADALAEYTNTVRCERAFCNQFFDLMRSGRIGESESEALAGKSLGRFLRSFPAGWIYWNQLCLNPILEGVPLRCVDISQHRVYPERLSPWESLPELKRTTPYNMFARLTLPATWKVVMKNARMQVVLDEANVACALERYRLANGQYPAELSALVPQFMPKMPSDVVSGQPLKYRREVEGGYVLYSVGWDQKDDGGIPIKPASRGSASREQGDWIWICPAL